MTDSPRWHFSKTDAISVGWFIFHSMVGALVSTLIVVADKTDFGMYSIPVAIIVGTLSKSVQKWVAGAPCQVSAPPVQTENGVTPMAVGI